VAWPKSTPNALNVLLMIFIARTRRQTYSDPKIYINLYIYIKSLCRHFAAALSAKAKKTEKRRPMAMTCLWQLAATPILHFMSPYGRALGLFH